MQFKSKPSSSLNITFIKFYLKKKAFIKLKNERKEKQIERV